MNQPLSIIPEPHAPMTWPRVVAMLRDGKTREQAMQRCLQDGFDSSGQGDLTEALLMFGDGQGGISVDAYAKSLQEPDARGDCFSPEAARELAEQVDAELKLLYGDKRAQKPQGVIYARTCQP